MFYPLSFPTKKQEVKGPTMKHQFQQSSLKRTGSIFYSFFVFKICSSLKSIILNDTKVYICICCAGSQRVSFFFDLSSKLFIAIYSIKYVLIFINLTKVSVYLNVIINRYYIPDKTEFRLS